MEQFTSSHYLEIPFVNETFKFRRLCAHAPVPLLSAMFSTPTMIPFRDGKL